MDEGASFSQQRIQFLTRTNSIFSIRFFWRRSWLLSCFCWLKRRWRILMKAIWSWPTMRFFPFIIIRMVFWGSTKDNISSTSFKCLEILVTNRPSSLMMEQRSDNWLVFWKRHFYGLLFFSDVFCFQKIKNPPLFVPRQLFFLLGLSANLSLTFHKSYSTSLLQVLDFGLGWDALFGGCRFKCCFLLFILLFHY